MLIIWEGEKIYTSQRPRQNTAFDETAATTGEKTVNAALLLILMHIFLDEETSLVQDGRRSGGDVGPVRLHRQRAP